MDRKEKNSPTQIGTASCSSLSNSQSYQQHDLKPGSAKEQPAGPAPLNFFDLPRQTRDQIYEQVLAIAHPLYMFQDPGPAQVGAFAPDIPPCWLVLLYTNRQIHREASTFLYEANKFTLSDDTRRHSDLLKAFLNCIGPMSAGSLAHVYIKFPTVAVIEIRDGFSKFGDEDELQSLRLLREECTSLSTLEMLVSSRGSTRLDRGGDSRFARETLSQIDLQLKEIPSLKRIVVRVFSGRPISSVMESLQSHGWAVLPASRDQW